MQPNKKPQMLTHVKFDNAWVSVVFIFVVWQRHLASTSFLNFAFRTSNFPPPSLLNYT